MSWMVIYPPHNIEQLECKCFVVSFSALCVHNRMWRIFGYSNIVEYFPIQIWICRCIWFTSPSIMHQSPSSTTLFVLLCLSVFTYVYIEMKIFQKCLVHSLEHISEHISKYYALVSESCSSLHWHLAASFRPVLPRVYDPPVSWRPPLATRLTSTFFLRLFAN